MNPILSSLPFARHKDEAPARWLVDVLWFVLATGEDTNGAYSLIEQFVPMGVGPPPHVHPFEDEMFFVIAGEMTIIVGGQKLVLGAGCLGHVPRNTVHEFTITGTEVCHCLNFYTPAGFEQAILCRWRRKRGPFWRVGRDHLSGYAMDSIWITRSLGFWLGCPTATGPCFATAGSFLIISEVPA